MTRDAVPARRPPRRAAPQTPRHRALLPMAAVYAAAVFSYCYWRHQHFGSSASELGAYHSVMWNIAFRASPWNSLERVHQYAIHLEPALALLAPLYRVSPSPVWLWLAESLCCAAAALPIDAVARRITGDPVIGLVSAAAMLLAPQMVLGQLADFHTLALCALPVAVMAWAVEVDSSRGLALGAVAAMGLREQMGGVVAVAALLWAVRQGRRRLAPAVLLAVVAASFSALEVFVVIPSFGSGVSAHYAAHYGHLGGSPEEIVRTTTHRPLAVLLEMVDAQRGRYLVELVSGALPLTVLALRSLRRSAWPLVFALPLLAIQLLSSFWQKWDVHYPYGVPVVPLIAAAAVLSLSYLPSGAPREARRFAASIWLGLTLLHLAGKLPSPVGPGRPIDPGFAGSDRAAALGRAIAALPPEASISAQDDVVPHVATRAEVHRWPDGGVTDDYVLLDLNGPAANVRNPYALAEALRRLRTNPDFEVVVDDAGVLLAKRVTR